jgi:hypothetical protein
MNLTKKIISIGLLCLSALFSKSYSSSLEEVLGVIHEPSCSISKNLYELTNHPEKYTSIFEKDKITQFNLPIRANQSGQNFFVFSFEYDPKSQNELASPSGFFSLELMIKDFFNQLSAFTDQAPKENEEISLIESILVDAPKKGKLREDLLSKVLDLKRSSLEANKKYEKKRQETISAAICSKTFEYFELWKQSPHTVIGSIHLSLSAKKVNKDGESPNENDLKNMAHFATIDELEELIIAHITTEIAKIFNFKTKGAGHPMYH